MCAGRDVGRDGNASRVGQVFYSIRMRFSVNIHLLYCLYVTHLFFNKKDTKYILIFFKNLH